MIWTQIAVGFTVLVCFTFLCYYCCRNRHMRTRFQTSVRQISAIPEPQLLLLVSLFLLFISFSVSLFRRLFLRFQNVSKSIRSLVLLCCILQTAWCSSCTIACFSSLFAYCCRFCFHGEAAEWWRRNSERRVENFSDNQCKRAQNSRSARRKPPVSFRYISFQLLSQFFLWSFLLARRKELW